MRHHLLIVFSLLATFSYADTAEEKPCIVDLENVPYLRDQAIMDSMSQSARASFSTDTWDLLSAKDGKIQLAACVDQKASCELASPYRRKRDTSSLYASVRDATLIVGRLFTCGNCDHLHFAFTNTAFAISEDGLCVMNYHCLEAFVKEDPAVKELHGYVIRTWDGRQYPVSEIVAGSENQDLAIVRVDLPEDERLTPLPLGNAADVGDRVYTLSHPGGLLYRFSAGMVTRNTVDEGKHPGHSENPDRPRMCISADYAVGSSGGPVVDDKGNLVGVISSTRTLYANGGPPNGQPQMVEKLCIPVSLLRELIEEASASPRPVFRHPAR